MKQHCTTCDGTGFVKGEIPEYLERFPYLSTEVMYWPLGRVPCDTCEGQGS